MNKIVQDGSRGGEDGSRGREDGSLGETGTTATLVQLEGAQSEGEQAGPGEVPSSPPSSALPNAVTVSPSHLRGQQQPQNQYLQVIQRADPPHPNPSHLWEFGRFSTGLGWEEKPQVKPFFPTSLLPATGLVLKDSFLCPRPGWVQAQKVGATQKEEAALLPAPPQR